MIKYGIIPDYLHCPYRDHRTGFCTHPDVQKPGYLKICVQIGTKFVAYKDGKKVCFPKDCPLKETPPSDFDKIRKVAETEYCLVNCCCKNALTNQCDGCALYEFLEVIIGHQEDAA